MRLPLCLFTPLVTYRFISLATVFMVAIASIGNILCVFFTATQCYYGAYHATHIKSLAGILAHRWVKLFVMTFLKIAPTLMAVN